MTTIRSILIVVLLSVAPLLPLSFKLRPAHSSWAMPSPPQCTLPFPTSHHPASHPWQMMMPRAAKAVVAVCAVHAAVLLAIPQTIEAAEMAAPKMAFFEGVSGDIKVGDAIYDEKAQLKAKLIMTRSNFDKMVNRVVSEVKTTSGEPQRRDAQATLSIYMGTLKSDMRQLSKIACDGDIYSRYNENGLSGTKEAKFDYNTGQFTLKPIAADAESVISAINDLYFNTVPTASTESIIDELKRAKDSFDDWFLLIEKL